MASNANQSDINDVTGVSRSGRVRKKSSKLIYLDTTSETIKTKKTSKSSQSSKSSKKKKSSNIENIDVRNQTQPPAQPSKDDETVNKPQKKNAKRASKDSTNLPTAKKMAIESPKAIPLNDTPVNAVVEKQPVEPTKESSQYNSTTNSDSETYSALSNNEIETPDYTSYDEESVNSDEDLLLPKKDTAVPGLAKLHPTSVAVNNAIPTANEQFVYTGYKLWSSEMKKEILRKYPAIDINVLNVRLGEMWTRLSTMERNNWHSRARAVAQKNGSQNECVMDYKTQAWLNSCRSVPLGQSSADVKLRNIELEPIDVAAYLRLLGESLMLIGAQFQRRKTPVVTSDCVTALLDSLLCAMGSLVCLTQQVPLLKTDKNTVFKKTLENIAYIMPGL